MGFGNDHDAMRARLTLLIAALLLWCLAVIAYVAVFGIMPHDVIYKHVTEAVLTEPGN